MEDVVNVEQVSQKQNVHITMKRNMMIQSIGKNVQNVEQKNQKVE